MYMKRWFITAVVCLMMLIPSTVFASSEVRLSAEDGGWRAEVWYDGTLFLRFVLADTVSVWQSDDDDKTVRACPVVEGGMLRLIVR